jgi:hypothetical protein
MSAMPRLCCKTHEIVGVISKKWISVLPCIDNKAGIIVDAEGTRANRIAEIAVTETMIERVKDRFDLQPRRLAGDTVYGAVRLLEAR